MQAVVVPSIGILSRWPYRAARDLGNVEAAGKEPISFGKQYARRKIYAKTKTFTRKLLRTSRRPFHSFQLASWVIACPWSLRSRKSSIHWASSAPTVTFFLLARYSDVADRGLPRLAFGTHQSYSGDDCQCVADTTHPKACTN